jgi:hypothetical protein
MIPRRAALDGLAPPPPPVVARKCESCGALDVTIFLPNHRDGGRRVCARCLGAFDRLRRREPVAGG